MEIATADDVMNVIKRIRTVHPDDYDGAAGPWIWVTDLRALGDTVPAVLEQAEENGSWDKGVMYLNEVIGCALAVPAPEKNFLDEFFDLIEECRVRAERYTDHMVNPGTIASRLQFSLRYVGHQMRAHMNAADVIEDDLDQALIIAQTAAEWAADAAVLAAMLVVEMSSISPNREID